VNIVKRKSVLKGHKKTNGNRVYNAHKARKLLTVIANAAKQGEAALGGKKANLKEFNDFEPWSKLPPEQQEKWNEKARRLNEGGELSTFEQELAMKMFTQVRLDMLKNHKAFGISKECDYSKVMSFRGVKINRGTLKNRILFDMNKVRSASHLDGGVYTKIPLRELLSGAHNLTVDNWPFDKELHHMERIADGLDGNAPYENEKIVFRVRGDDEGPRKRRRTSIGVKTTSAGATGSKIAKGALAKKSMSMKDGGSARRQGKLA
ncbi:hypothetical protein HK101_004265, partial [Irineochytrium annulatum]